MKKWEEPQVTNLSLQETKGGTVFSTDSDGHVWDPKHNTWWESLSKKS